MGPLCLHLHFVLEIIFPVLSLHISSSHLHTCCFEILHVLVGLGFDDGDATIGLGVMSCIKGGGPSAMVRLALMSSGFVHSSPNPTSSPKFPLKHKMPRMKYSLFMIEK